MRWGADVAGKVWANPRVECRGPGVVAGVLGVVGACHSRLLLP